ncbi:hypothetical protein M23134_00300 [Microscilla marina ATCC 23134]|uniref:Uncharacterized protein n=2 Tax=Microscilla marina TaxID=1027 RepID=A1ZP67_MICM2|nr:hypothetical protein M23134_00300 [Microscilla marina ATCC 23134]
MSPAASNVNNDQLPLRFLYPSNEQSLSVANYQTAVNNLGAMLNWG